MGCQSKAKILLAALRIYANQTARSIRYLCRQPNFMSPYIGLLGAFAMNAKLQTSLSSSISHRSAVAGPGYRLLLWQVCWCPPGYQRQVPIHHQPPDPSLSGSVFTSTHPTQFLQDCVCVPPTLSTHTQLTLSLPTPAFRPQRTQGRVNVMSHIISSCHCCTAHRQYLNM